MPTHIFEILTAATAETQPLQAQPENGHADESPQQRRTRTLQIEVFRETLDSPKKPRIRIVGHWLERAGFNPGNRVQIIQVAPGVMELCSFNPITSDA